MRRGRSIRGAAAVAVAVLALAGAACSDDGEDAAAEVRPLDDVLRLNDLQVLGSHNSYHQEAAPEVMALLRAFDPTLADSLEYSHPPLAEQFEEQGIRQIVGPSPVTTRTTMHDSSQRRKSRRPFPNWLGRRERR